MNLLFGIKQFFLQTQMLLLLELLLELLPLFLPMLLLIENPPRVHHRRLPNLEA